MNLQSMTGFSRAEGQSAAASWIWEIRSVNNKGLDIKIRLPSGCEALEPKTRTLLSKTFSRGSLQVSLQLTQEITTQVPVVNMKVVDAYLVHVQALSDKLGRELPTISEMMSMKGVVNFEEEGTSKDVRSELEDQLLEGLQESVQTLQSMRQVEGVKLGEVLQQKIDMISQILDQMVADESRSTSAVLTQMKVQLDKLLGGSTEINEDRLHQEVALLATKMDIQEELDRLEMHISAVNELLTKGGPVGRKLDFLAQEFNRECNTICSKSNSSKITSLGLDMKLVIDQFREQIANME